MSKPCYLQTIAETEMNRGSLGICQTELWWKLVEVKHIGTPGFFHTNVLLYFDSYASRKRFIKKFGEKNERMLSVKSLIVKHGPWDYAPFIKMRAATMFEKKFCRVQKDYNELKRVVAEYKTKIEEMYKNDEFKD